MPEPRPSRVRWLILAILFLVTTNNYLDRILLTVLSPVILDDLHFNEMQFGYVNSAFQFSYAIGFLIMGKLIDRQGTRLGYSVAIVFWSVAAALHALARNFVDLSFWRGLLGLGESGNFPAAIKAVSEWFPKKDRALATGIFNSGTNIASVVGPPVFVWMNFHYGWRACFLITASTGTICLLLWWWIYREPRRQPWVNKAELAIIESDPEEKHAAQLSWMDVLKYRETYGFALAKFFSDPVWWFYLTWMALYFKRARGLSLQEIGWAIPAVYFTASFGSVAGGWLSGYLIERGWASGTARKTALGLFALCMPVAATAVAVKSIFAAVALISLACAAHQGWSANLYTTASDVFPKSAVASVTGIGSFMGGIGGVIFTALLPGYVITRFGYTPIFVMMGSFHIIAWIIVQVYMGKIQPITDPKAVSS